MLDVQEFRAEPKGFDPGPRRDIAEITEVRPPGVRICRSTEDTNTAVLVYLHGGAFVRGDLEASDVLCREVAARGPCVVVSVDYRLAPEHLFPAALEDANAAIAWTRKNIEEYGGDPKRIALGGDSVGANLATVTANRNLAGEILVSGLFGLDDHLPESLVTNNEQEVLDGVAELYAGGVPLGDPRLSPLRRKDFRDAPPTFLVTSGGDPFVYQSQMLEGAPLRTRASDQIFAMLRDQICAGEIARGERLPTEKELAARYGVSVNTIREAVRGLSLMGLIEIQHGSGAYVTGSASGVVGTSLGMLLRFEHSGVTDVVCLAGVLHGHAATLAIERATEDDINALREAIDGITGETAGVLGPQVERFLVTFVDATHDPLLGALSRMLDRVVITVITDVYGPDSSTLTAEIGISGRSGSPFSTR
ncbi:alpha/beta hydrolase fold domain-containing protein [Kibdelosporangium philippinense]|uniref:Alpha/beta hydrolase fold domain-containing protein n=1 Tax=Kibdelosporangium philippinense TaxID=211113 RepID=A0ABS8Z4X0_9PSEU|nr:alpha/beta hydrolase fold domain-containing protein [Kibdelosporangium philippinense]MCE7002961.1 alpha/beta hydrolase fold domain-containing protein [Kibdelosporangium philippinense]